MRRRIECWLHRRWYGDVHPSWSLRAAERLYASRVAPSARPAGRPPRPVIVVGNLVAGGGGKTPVVAAIARYLADEGFAVAMIGRGYRGRAGRGPLRVRADGAARVFGDEALELVRATGLPMWIGSRRAATLAAAVDAGADVIVSDDGLQHAGLPRSLEVCVIDGRRGLGNARLLPAGPLRQPVGRLSTVDLVLIKRSAKMADGLPDGTAFELETGALAPLGEECAPPRPGTAIDAVAGIADPAAFFERLQALGFDVRAHPLGDHEPIPTDWFERLPGPVVVTGKDAARLDDPRRGDVFVLPVRAALPDAVLHRIGAHVREFGQ